MNRILSIIVIVMSSGLGFLVSEIGYRYVLYNQNMSRFHVAESNHIGVYDKSHWIYDERFGYGYPPGRKINYTGIGRNGEVLACNLIDVINDRGNIGPIEGNYENADLKILIFGDSWAAFNINNLTWTDFFQREMSERLASDVHVVNFGRDGYGILQMFDLAAYEIERWNPDLVVFAFITNDLARLRTWRLNLMKDGHEDRVVTTFEPTQAPDFEKTFDTFLIEKLATKEWCEENVNTGIPNEIGRRILQKRERLIDPEGIRPADIYTFSHSYLVSRLLYGTPFAGIKDRYNFPSMQINSYAEDEGFVMALEKIRKTGVPVVMFHHAFYPEVVAGEEYIVTYNEQSLLNSLIELTGFPLVETLENVDLPIHQPERMNASETNFHPSLWGMEFYSNALTRALIDKGLLDELIPNETRKWNSEIE